MDYGKEFKKYATKHHGINAMYYDKIVSSMTPYIIEERQLNVAQMDVFSRLMMDRIMFLGTAINDQVANVIQRNFCFYKVSIASAIFKCISIHQEGVYMLV
jgi:ATP-dependent Clp protease protease subunit